MIRKISSVSGTMFVLSTIYHEIYGSNPVSCCPDLGESTRIKDVEKMANGSTMVEHSTTHHEIFDLNPASYCLELR
jgi:hypothetical protein